MTLSRHKEAVFSVSSPCHALDNYLGSSPYVGMCFKKWSTLLYVCSFECFLFKRAGLQMRAKAGWTFCSVCLAGIPLITGPDPDETQPLPSGLCTVLPSQEHSDTDCSCTAFSLKWVRSKTSDWWLVVFLSNWNPSFCPDFLHGAALCPVIFCMFSKIDRRPAVNCNFWVLPKMWLGLFWAKSLCCISGCTFKVIVLLEGKPLP